MAWVASQSPPRGATWVMLSIGGKRKIMRSRDDSEGGKYWEQEEDFCEYYKCEWCEKCRFDFPDEAEEDYYQPRTNGLLAE